MSMCINCGNAFEVKAKGYKRHSLVKQVGKVECVKDALDEVYETNLTPLGHKKLTFVKRVILAVKRHDYESAISILYHRSARVRKQIATVISNKLFKCFQHVGICLGVNGTRGTIDRMRKNFDKEMYDMKSKIEEELRDDAPNISSDDGDIDVAFDNMDSRPNVHTTDGVTTIPLQELMTSPTTSSESDCSASESEISITSASSDDKSTEEGGVSYRRSLFGPDTGPGYSLCWDNVQKLSLSRYHTSSKQNKFLMWAMCFATQNRVPAMHLNDEKRELATTIPLNYFLPSQEDWDALEKRMGVVVSRIICKHLTHFKSYYSDCVVEHIIHEQSELSKKKSKVINLGVVQENPGSSKGVLAIMKHLKKYVPMQPDGTPYTILCNGDQQSVERMIDARISMAASEDPANRLAGLEPAPQEFHRRGIVLQDIMDKMYNAKSAGSKGTLYNIKTVFKHKNVKTKVMDNMNEVTDLLTFTTEGLVSLLCIKLLGLDDIDDKPANSPCEERKELRQQYLQTVSKNVVTHVWPVIDTCSISQAANSDDEEDARVFCICDPDEGVDCETWIECSAGKSCALGRWYHIECVNLEEDNLPGEDEEWWCSPDCEKSVSFCCKVYQPGIEVVKCMAGNNCLNGERFHVDCKGLVELPVDDWYCSVACYKYKEASDKKDHIAEYTTALTWKGLKYFCEKDSERENDGEAMMRTWRINMIDFWSNNHYKYLILGHRLLAGINGWMTQRISHELKYNRTANLTGGAGHNIPLDLVNEFLNNEFKDNLKHTHGQYSDSQVARTSQLVGNLGSKMDQAYFSKVIDIHISRTRASKESYVDDVRKFILTYRHDGLFDVVDGRRHKDFPDFENKITIEMPQKLRTRLHKYSTNLDAERSCLPTE
uniref:Uncharacterized protein LOC100378528 n=1 Tax=Saccoglossus kowalevskii TaxID=10224 RepID=A0ABM0GT47_SACKO|nr:PREDICTED: uncharacterized protein LOC100378528 [Saccoglossus kowalevskii]